MGAPGTITFASSLSGQTINLTTVGDGTFGPSGLLVTGQPVIDGGSNHITISANSGMRMFYVKAGGNLTLRNLTISGGHVTGGGSGLGGAAAGLGGAIVNAGTLNIIQSTFTDNSATGGSTSGNTFAGGGLAGPGSSGVYGQGGAPNGGAYQTDGGFGGGGGAWARAGGFGAGGGDGGGAGGFGGGGSLGWPGTDMFPPTNPGAPGFGGGAASGTTGTGGGGAGMGGAVFNYGGTISITNSTFANNSAVAGTRASGLGGAIFNLNGNVFVRFSTLHNNIASNGGGAVYSLGDNAVATQAGPALPSTVPNVLGGIAFTDSIFAGSTNGSGTAVADVVQFGRNGGQSLSSGSNNIIQTRSAGDFAGSNTTTANPQLGALASNGGPTQTMALLANSPAINAGVAISVVSADQRGVARPQGFAPDIGAYERQATGQLFGAGYEYETRQAVTFDFTGDASPTFARSSYSIQNLTTGQTLPSSTGTFSFNATGNQATLVLTNLLSDGNYRLTGDGLQLDFFVLAGDADHDRDVDVNDLGILASNWQQSGRTFSQGNFDYSAGGTVDVNDLGILASHWQQNLVPPVAPSEVGGTRNLSGSLRDTIFASPIVEPANSA
jgi:hypothetical protein